MARQPAPATRIQKAGNGHSYFLDGERVPGVTTILGGGLPKPALVGWAANVTAEYVVNRLATAKASDGRVRIVADELVEDLRRDNQLSRYPERWSDHDTLPRHTIAKVLAGARYRDRDAAASRGTEVHGYAEQLARGEEIVVPDELTGHVDSYMRFLDEWRPYDAVLERVIVNRRYRYMGKFDILAWYEDLPPWMASRIPHDPPYLVLGDVKTSRSGIFPDTGLQLEAYRRGETMLDGGEEVPMPAVDAIMAIHVRSDGYDVVAFDVETETRPTTFDIFLYCMQVGRWLDDKNGASATIRSDRLAPPFPGGQ